MNINMSIFVFSNTMRFTFDITDTTNQFNILKYSVVKEFPENNLKRVAKVVS